MGLVNGYMKSPEGALLWCGWDRVGAVIRPTCSARVALWSGCGLEAAELPPASPTSSAASAVVVRSVEK